MIMGKFTLKPAHTFKAKADIPLHGGGVSPVEFEFRHRTRDELEAWLKDSVERSDVDAILDMTSGWELEDAFGRESVEQLVQSYMGAARSIFDKYIDTLAQRRLGN